MPTYEYICDDCSHEFEEFQSITAKPLKKCPECTKPKLRRKIGTGAGIIFKGSGFYETDYRSESYKQGAKAEKDAGKPKSDSDSKSSSSETKKADTKAESKPAAKKPESNKPSTPKKD